MLVKSRAFLLSLTIVAVLVFSAFGPTIVYADGGTATDTPPPTETSSTCTSDGTSSECPTEAVATEAPVEATGEATEVPVEATSVPTEVATEATPEPAVEATEVPVEEAAPVAEEAAPPAEVAPVAETTILNEVPENTTVTVLDAQGQAQPLATQASADAIATSDPIWCPGTQVPTPGANGCTQSFTSFTDLLTFLSGNATFQGAGTIYVQQGAYQGGESTVDFNNYNLSNLSGSDLTITGGWNTGSGAIDPANVSTFNNVAIVIGSSTNPWGGSLSLSNLALNFNPNGQSGTGITLYTQNDINISNVSVMNAANGAGAELNASGDVNINNSKFDRNKTAGAIIRSAGNVSIANSSFSNPGPLTGRRQDKGVDIVADGSVSLLNVMANFNREVGANINAGGRVSISTSVFSGTKIIKGSEFLGYGLTVVTPGIIDLESVTANDNFLWGASLNAGGDVNINNSIFNLNTTESPGFIDDTGLLVTSGGNVSINNSHADENRLIGATINATGDVSINNSTFSSNNGVTLSSGGAQTFHGYGLQVMTPGSIFISGVTASDNTLFGAMLDAGVDVTIANSNFSNQTTGSATDLLGRGLEVISDGNVFLDTVTLDNNQTFGANIQAGGDIFLDMITATNNGTNGVEVEASCTTVFLINGNYSGNGQYGLSIINAALNQSGAPVFGTNGTGNIFQDPGTCVFTPINPPAPVTPPVNDTGSTPAALPAQQTTIASSQGTNKSVFSSVSLGGLPVKSSGGSSSPGAVTLNSFLANTRSLTGSTHIGIFTGQYAYIYSSAGMQIIAFSPISVSEVAMVGPH